MTRTPVPFDYDDDPGRVRAWQPTSDVHEAVAERVVEEGLSPVLDLGCGHGRLAAALPSESIWIGADLSATQLRDAPRRTVRADVAVLPISAESVGAVAALWMLYHLDEPRTVINEARRVLRQGGLFVASTGRRDDSPELLPVAAPTTFDAEEAPGLVAEVFGTVEVESWDAPLVVLRDRDEVARYLVQHLADPSLGDGVSLPLTLTKRGSLVWARKQN